MTEIQGKSILVRVSARFELARVRVSEGSSYRESTVYIAPFRGIRDPGNLCLWCVWNPESWSLESGKQLKESRIPSTIGFRSPKSTDKESGIHGVESRIQVSWIPLHITPVKLRNFKKRKFKNKIRNVLNEQKIIIRC